MSSSRSSVDGTSQQRTKREPTRPHPPRLQHSPSLPNIWFPPHSGPIPPQLTEIARDNLHLPSTPSALKTHFSLPGSADSPQRSKAQLAEPPQIQIQNATNHHTSPKKSLHPRTLSKIQSQKAPRRPRGDRKDSHNLLTPPLTPSSSIRTTASIESAATSNGLHVDTESGDQTSQFAGTEGEDSEPNSTSTRFLLISNVSRTVPSSTLNSAIFTSLSAVNLDGLLPFHDGEVNPANSSTSRMQGSLQPKGSTLRVPSTPPNHNIHSPVSESPIKGVFVRYRASHGVVILAFWDVRYAEAAQLFLTTRSTGGLDRCVEQDTHPDGSKRWLDCRFVTADALVEMVGDSLFLQTSDAGFCITVEGSDPTAKELRISDDNTADFDKSSSSDGWTKREINLTMLKNMLVAYGGIRSFEHGNSQRDKDQNSMVIRVEYYDIRDSDTAYTDLDGQVIFGMKLKVFGREGFQSQPDYDVVDQPEAPTNNIPFPSSPLPERSDKLMRFSPAGHHSQTRERYVFPDASGKSSAERTHNAEHGLRNSGPSFDPPPSSASSITLIDSSASGVDPNLKPASPTYFYTSPRSDTPKHTELPDAVDGRNPAEYMPDMRQLSIDPYTAPGGGRDLQRDGEVINAEQPSPQSYYYGGQPECYYFPPRAPSAAPGPMIGPTYSYVCPTPPPSAPAVPYPPPPQNAPFPPPSPVVNFSYNYEYREVQPASGVGMSTWTFEQAMLNNPGPYASALGPGAGPPPTTEYWQGMASSSSPDGSAFYTLGQLQPQSGHLGPAPPGPIPSQNSSSSFQALQQSSSPSPPHFVTRNGQTIHHPSSPFTHIKQPNPAPERNQLKLEEIEDGQDTRTTVMIKNIPNKMSDKDLISFINKVCLRRIDFLYLRMDFKNGCNVGYAFVNFITVQDLLCFARQRLGQKWNMFSSEKVLQMSYANYQGKEACVEKFKNSCIMDECESWRPKIFYSEPGPEQGLPEPFPAPTHLRRKERSSHNRGDLFPPGSGGLQNHGHLNASSSSRRRSELDNNRSRHRHRFGDDHEPRMHMLPMTRRTD